jgi:hypothetical protein
MARHYINCVSSLSADQRLARASSCSMARRPKRWRPVISDHCHHPCPLIK